MYILSVLLNIVYSKLIITILIELYVKKNIYFFINLILIIVKMNNSIFKTDKFYKKQLSYSNILDNEYRLLTESRVQYNLELELIDNINVNFKNFINYIIASKDINIDYDDNNIECITNNTYSLINYKLFIKLMYSIIKLISTDFNKSNSLDIIINKLQSNTRNSNCLILEFYNSKPISINSNLYNSSNISNRNYNNSNYNNNNYNNNNLYQSIIFTLAQQLNYNIKFYHNFKENTTFFNRIIVSINLFNNTDNNINSYINTNSISLTKPNKYINNNLLL